MAILLRVHVIALSRRWTPIDVIGNLNSLNGLFRIVE